MTRTMTDPPLVSRGIAPRKTGVDRDSVPEILTSQEARELLRIGRTKLWELTKQGEIPAYRIGSGRASSLRYKKSDLIQWLESNRVEA
jgi:excisionase family DNA binding protein